MNSKLKGARGEREVCALLRLWWAPVSDARFERSPGSGGWQGKKEFDTTGDIVCSDPTFPFSVECKFRENWSWENFIKDGKSPVHKWWEQTLHQASLTNKVPCLFFRKSRMIWQVMLPSSYIGVVTPDFQSKRNTIVLSSKRFFDVPPAHFI